MTGPRVIVALDFPSPAQAIGLVERLPAGSCRVKVGKELFTAGGPGLVAELAARGFDVFLDLKFHDIPNTVASACRAAALAGAWMIDVHALGGRRMMTAAREAIVSMVRRPRLVGVTVLTSMAAEDLREVGIDADPESAVLRLASLARESGLDGVVCSAREVAALRTACGNEFELVTPGIRPGGVDAGDQRRTATPGEAISSGASYLVIGRPITASPNPAKALADICAEIDLAERSLR